LVITAWFEQRPGRVETVSCKPEGLHYDDHGRPEGLHYDDEYDAAADDVKYG